MHLAIDGNWHWLVYVGFSAHLILFDLVWQRASVQRCGEYWRVLDDVDMLGWWGPLDRVGLQYSCISLRPRPGSKMEHNGALALARMLRAVGPWTARLL